MDTGKAEYAPDYKSDYEAAMRDGKIGDAMLIAQKEQSEHQRLKLAVVEAAKAWEENSYSSEVTRRLRITTQSLIAFESEHGITAED